MSLNRCAWLLAVLGLTACRPQQKPDSEVLKEVAAFVTASEQKARQLAVAEHVEISKDVRRFFERVKSGDWSEAANLFEAFQSESQPEVDPESPVASVVWPVVVEVDLAMEAFMGGEKYVRAFGQGILRSIPPGSIYFGGTDPGRGLVTMFSADHAAGDPFFTLTQNALADNRYLRYLRHLYGVKIHVPTDQESQQAFSEYLKDAQERLEHDREFPNKPRRIKPGEDVRIIDDKVQVSGQLAVMSINAILARIIFDQNPEHEFYIEESFPLDWMYPHLEPHQLIFRINREPLDVLSSEVIDQDREFWRAQTDAMIGDWLRPDTSVSEVCRFVGRVYVRKELDGFQGDPAFVENSDACKMFSKLRSSQGGMYAWRLNRPAGSERERLLAAADLAFRQAFALCPFSPEAIFRYTNLLVGTNRVGEGIELVTTALSADPDNDQLKGLLKQLESMNRQLIQ